MDLGWRHAAVQQAELNIQVRQQVQALKKLAEIMDPDFIDKDLLPIVAAAKYPKRILSKCKEVLSGIPNCWPKAVKTRLMELDWEEEAYDIMDVCRWVTIDANPKASSSSLLYLGPPLGNCVKCNRYLVISNKPVSVKFAATDGTVFWKKKVTLRCKSCSVNFGFDKYGNATEGYRFYSAPRDCIMANDCVVVERGIFRLQWSFSLHAWVSFEGFAESWQSGNGVMPDLWIDRRVWADCYWWGEVEHELREMDMIDYVFYKDQDREVFMMSIDCSRKKEVYEHLEEDCTYECKARGCGRLWVLDGIWKLMFSHCMWSMKNVVHDIPMLNLPEVCTNETLPGMAFCATHTDFCRKQNPPVPTRLRDFLRYAGKGDADADTMHDDHDEDFTQSTSTSIKYDHPYAVTTVMELASVPLLVDNATGVGELMRNCDPAPGNCNMDLGEKSVLRKMSRGHMFAVRGGGHIDMWTPLYESESLGQVFLFVISLMYALVKDNGVVPRKVWLAYDNMCQLNRLKASKKKLPLDEPFSRMWMDVNKVIDAFHIVNHKDSTCHTDLHPDNIAEMYPDLKDTKNTQAAEQTFIWLGRYKKIVCSMSKVHHLFYIHRQVKRRNWYTARCYQLGKKPLLPGTKKK